MIQPLILCPQLLSLSLAHSTRLALIMASILVTQTLHLLFPMLEILSRYKHDSCLISFCLYQVLPNEKCLSDYPIYNLPPSTP